jgi:hypothetical protein
MKRDFKKRVLYGLISISLGCLFGYGLLWMWFFISLIFFRSGDSGPAWINTANNIVLCSGIVFGIIGAEYFFTHYDKMKNKDN